MAILYNASAANALVPIFVGATDPSLDAANHVLAGKLWCDTTSGFVLKIRNSGNTGWDTLASSTLDEQLVAYLAQFYGA